MTVIEAAKKAYDKYAELESKIGREAAIEISFEVLKKELAKVNE